MSSVGKHQQNWTYSSTDAGSKLKDRLRNRYSRSNRLQEQLVRQTEEFMRDEKQNLTPQSTVTESSRRSETGTQSQRQTAS